MARAAVVAVVACLVVLAYWPVLEAQTIALDDTIIVTQNPLVTHPSWYSTRRFFVEVLTPSSVSAYYMPLSMTSLMLDWAMGGRAEDLRVFHYTSLALHVSSVILILLILEELGRGLIPAAFAALFFGLHPLAVEGIASIGERKTVLASCFALLSILHYVRYCRGKGSWSFVLSVLCFALALLSKPSVTTLPLLLLVLDYWPLRRLGWKSLGEKWPFVILSMTSVAVTTLAVARTWEFGTLPKTSPFQVTLEVAFLLAFYLGKIIRPLDLTSVYPPPPSFTLANQDVFLSFVIVSAITALTVVLVRRTRAPLAGWATFVLALAPTFGILAWSPLIAYDRYAYFPLLGLTLLAGAGFEAVWRSLGARQSAFGGLVIAIGVLVVGGEAWALRMALVPWRNSITYWQHAVALAPDRAESHNGLGTALQDAGDIDGAVNQYRRALACNPNHPFAQLNLGVLDSRQGRGADGINHLLRACELQPGSASNFVQLGLALQREGRLDQAAAQFQHALDLKPGYLRAIQAIGHLRLAQGRNEEGTRLLRQAVGLFPHDPRTKFGLAIALVSLPGHGAEARRLLREAIQEEPGWAPPWNELAWVMATDPDPSLRDPQEALRLARQAVKMTKGMDANALDTQAAALAAAGQFERAVEVARGAALLARRAGLDSLDQAIEGRLSLYERRTRFMQAPALPRR